MAICMENYYFSCDVEEDLTLLQSVWRIISVVTLKKISRYGNLYGELLFQLLPEEDLT